MLVAHTPRGGSATATRRRLRSHSQRRADDFARFTEQFFLTGPASSSAPTLTPTVLEQTAHALDLQQLYALAPAYARQYVDLGHALLALVLASKGVG